MPVAPAICAVVMSTNSNPETRKAILSLLSQEPMPEVIVVNTGAGSLSSILSDLMDKIVLVENSTRLLPGGTRNLARHMSTAPYVAFLAADCLAADGWIAHRLKSHEQGHQTVASAILPADSSPASWASLALTHFKRLPNTDDQTATRYSLSYSRVLLDRLGWFDEQLRVGEDTVMNERCERIVGTPLWNPRVVTFHKYPTSVRGALADQYSRGRRAADFSRKSNVSVAKHVGYIAKKTLKVVREARNIPDPRVRRAIRGAVPLLLPLFGAYALGAISSFIANQE